MNQEDLNALMRNPWEAAKKPRPQPLPECPQCGERYCGDGIAFCTECANTVTPNELISSTDDWTIETASGDVQENTVIDDELDGNGDYQQVSRTTRWVFACVEATSTLLAEMVTDRAL